MADLAAPPAMATIVKLLDFTDTRASARYLAALARKLATPGLEAVFCAGDFTNFGKGGDLPLS